MPSAQRKILFLLFFLSGFCGLLYQTVWLRLAFASFGIITPVLSVVISVFMLGLSLGSWGGGKWIGPLTRRSGRSAVTWYAAAELVIGLGALVVPWLFGVGERFLLSTGESDSFRYLLYSALVLTATILPWCVCMGVTFPFMMAYVREQRTDDGNSFSFLYLANVIGAMCGTLVTAVVLIELFGFRRTLWIAGGTNLLIAMVGFWLGKGRPSAAPLQEKEAVVSRPRVAVAGPAGHRLWLLFTTGFTSMAMEVAWTRGFTPALGTQVYAFAALLFVYLLATWIGSYIYRRDLATGQPQPAQVLVAYITISAFLPAVMNDPRLIPNVPTLWGSIRAIPALMSIFPFCALLGYLTPQLIDDDSSGVPDRAGKAYAVNIAGCILGPLVAGYALLPKLGVQGTLVILAVPFIAFFVRSVSFLESGLRAGSSLVAVALACHALFFARSYETLVPSQVTHEIRRDHVATVVNIKHGEERLMYVNGIEITVVTPITKYMAHLPLGFHPAKPEKALVICFGMGTTYRSLLSWGIGATAVELSPSVRDSFGFFFADAPTVLRNPKGHIVVDDGRRFLNRTSEKFDIITIDPPPPSEAAGSSLLYSEEFYRAAQRRLKPGGILQQWYGRGDSQTVGAVARSLANTFPYVRVFPSLEGWGYHFLASLEPLPTPTPAQIWDRLPASARTDLCEWFPSDLTEAQKIKTFEAILTREIPLQKIVSPNPAVRITDDHPFNEYFLLRQVGWAEQ